MDDDDKDDSNKESKMKKGKYVTELNGENAMQGGGLGDV